MAQKNYFAIVNIRTGKLLLNSALLPIYWRQDVAKEVADRYPGYKVVPVSMEQLEFLIKNS